MAQSGRGRGAAGKVEAPKAALPAKKGAKMKEIIEDLDNYDDDMNEKELPAS